MSTVPDFTVTTDDVGSSGDRRRNLVQIIFWSVWSQRTTTTLSSLSFYRPDAFSTTHPTVSKH